MTIGYNQNALDRESEKYADSWADKLCARTQKKYFHFYDIKTFPSHIWSNIVARSGAQHW